MARFTRGALLAVGLWIGMDAALYAAVPRQGEESGTIVTINGDEEIQFIAEANWRIAEIYARPIVISETTQAKIAPWFETEELDRTTVRGRSEEVTLYTITRSKA